MMHYGIALLLTVSLLPALAGFGAALWLGLDPQALARVLATPGVGLSLASSVWSGVIATAVSLALAHLAVAVAVTGGWRRRLHAFTLPLLAVPHLAIGIGLVLVLAPSGLLLRLFSPWATGFLVPPDWLSVQDPLGLSLIAGLVVKESAFLVLVLSAALAQVPSGELLKQSRALGYGALKGWWIAVVPSLQRQIRLPLAAVLVFGIGNVEMAIPLGPDLPPTFSMLLWRWFTDPDPAMYRQAYSGALVLLVVNLLALAGWALMARLGQSLWQRSAESGQRRRRDSAARAGVVVVTASLWLLGSLALAAVLIRSAAGPWPFPAVLPQGGAFAAWQTMLPVAAGVAGDTLLLALATALAATALVLPAAERAAARPELRRRIGALLFLPLLLPQMTFLFGVQVLLTRLHIDGSAGGVLWSHLIFALPYLWGVLAAARANIDPRYASVARTLGSGRAATWRRVTAPLMLRSLLLALALGFSISIALYLPTLFAGAGRIATAATEAAAAAGAGSLRLAAVYAVLLALAPLAAFAGAYGIGAAVFRRRAGVPG